MTAADFTEPPGFTEKACPKSKHSQRTTCVIKTINKHSCPTKTTPMHTLTSFHEDRGEVHGPHSEEAVL
jgi:hypothetical protein